MINLDEVTLNYPNPVFDQLALEVARDRALADAPTALLPLVEVVEAARHDRERYRGRRRAPGTRSAEDLLVFGFLVAAYLAVCVAVVVGAS